MTNSHLVKRIIFLNLVSFLVLPISCRRIGQSDANSRVIVFYASCFSSVFDSIRNEAAKALNIELVTESSGSQVAMRKVTELGRECDLLILADNNLFKKIAFDKCKWRIDFSTDEVVLAIGIRAKKTDEAERDWVRVLLDDNILLGRIDENLAPIGYRTLIVWKLEELAGHPELMEQLKRKSSKVVDDVATLAALLSSGDVDYGFLYKSTCVAYDIRYIPLDRTINLGSPDVDYSKAEVTFLEPGSRDAKLIAVRGEMAINSLSIPEGAANREKAIALARYLLVDKADILKSHGFVAFKPRFYGTKQHYEQFKDFTEYSGEF